MLKLKNPKTCSCGITYLFWNTSACEVNEMGTWFNCPSCKSTMLEVAKVFEDAIAMSEIFRIAKRMDIEENNNDGINRY